MIFPLGRLNKTKTLKFAAVLALSALSSGCGPIISFGEQGPVDEVFSLRYPGEQQATDNSGPVVYIDEPHVAEGLGGIDIAVQLAGNRRSTLAGAAWAADLSTLVRDYFTQALGAETDARPVGEGGLDVKADCRLGIKIWRFDFVPGQTIKEDSVDVRIELSLMRLWDSHLLSQSSFSQQPAVDGKGAEALVASFSVAMKEVSTSMAGAFKDQLKACQERPMARKRQG